MKDHLPYHERSLETQTLDALLRIEEQLIKLNGYFEERAAAKTAAAKGKK